MTRQLKAISRVESSLLLLLLLLGPVQRDEGGEEAVGVAGRSRWKWLFVGRKSAPLARPIAHLRLGKRRKEEEEGRSVGKRGHGSKKINYHKVNILNRKRSESK